MTPETPDGDRVLRRRVALGVPWPPPQREALAQHLGSGLGIAPAEVRPSRGHAPLRTRPTSAIGWQQFADRAERSHTIAHPPSGRNAAGGEAQQLAAAAGIMSIPTLMVFREKVLVFSQPGAIPGAALEDLISQVRELDMDEVHRAVAEAGAA